MDELAQEDHHDGATFAERARHDLHPQQAGPFGRLPSRVRSELTKNGHDLMYSTRW